MGSFAVMILLTCVLATASAGSSSCDIGQHWQEIPGALTYVSSGDAGVWGVNSAGNIFYRNGTYGGNKFRDNPDSRNFGYDISTGTGWVQVDGGLTKIDVGLNSVFGTVQGRVFYRTGISQANPVGNGWTEIRGLDTALVSVSDVDGKVWSIENYYNTIFRRVGMSDELPGGTHWEGVPGIKATSLDIGGAGVWAVTPDGEVYYRTGSRQDCQGSGWQLVPAKLVNSWNAPVPVGVKQIASGGDSVWILASGGNIYYRFGITSSNPTGTHWIQVPGNQDHLSVSTGNNALWGIFGNKIFARTQ